MGSDSEDSDEEGGLGNVNRIITRPPGHSGKAKKGHLCFDAAFETGNLGRVDLVGEFEYDLFLRPDTANPRFRFWFNFTVDNCKQDQRVLFNVVNMSKANNLFGLGMTPIVKSSGRPKWQRIPKQHTFYLKSPHHQNHHILSFVFAFDREDEVYQFALTYPYSYSRLQAFLQVLEQRAPNSFERTSLIESVQKRRLELITFDDVKKPEVIEPKNAIRVIVVIARVHPGETPSSYVVQGLIEFLAIANHPIAKLLRENVVFKILPMINPDGVFLGNNRVNLLGHDLNRYWNNISYYTHPTLSATMEMLKEYDTSECYQLDFIIDIHAHSTLMGCFIYGNAYEDVYRYERHLVFPKLFASKCSDFMNENMIFNADDRKSGTARRYLCNRLSDNVNIYTLEVSMSGYYVKGTNILTSYTESDYMKIGRNLARALLEYYRFTNILPIPPLCEILSKRKGRPKTHRPRRKFNSETLKRPTTTRTYAPITYTDLSICYDSDTSNDLSPARYQFHSNFMHYQNRLNRMAYMTDQYYKPSKFGTMDLNLYQGKKSTKSKKTASTTSGESLPKVEMISVAPKPYLSIIDFNLLTRGGLEEAANIKRPAPDKTICPHHYQRLRSKTTHDLKNKFLNSQ